jgi:hypothetical protein
MTSRILERRREITWFAKRQQQIANRLRVAILKNNFLNDPDISPPQIRPSGNGGVGRTGSWHECRPGRFVVADWLGCV